MHNKRINVLNVSRFGEHIDSPVYMFPQTRDITCYAKDSKSFVKDKDNIFHYRGLTFTIENGSLICDGFKIKLPTRDSISTMERVILSLGYLVCSFFEIF